MLSLPIAFSSVIGVFAPVFSRPVWPHVKVLLTGAVLAPGKRTVTAILQIMGRSAVSDFQTYPRVLHRAVWSSPFFPVKASERTRRFSGVGPPAFPALVPRVVGPGPTCGARPASGVAHMRCTASCPSVH